MEVLLKTVNETFKRGILIYDRLHLGFVPDREEVIRNLCDHSKIAKAANDRRKELLIFSGAAFDALSIDREELKTGYMASHFSVFRRISRKAICTERPSRCDLPSC